jgi:hypothetical protein
MLLSKYYTPILTVFTIIATYLLPWWFIPTGIAAITFFAKDISPAKGLALATGITTSIWLAWAGFQEFSAVNKVSVLTGQIFANQPPSVIYLATGLSISIISGLAALFGGKIRDLFA